MYLVCIAKLRYVVVNREGMCICFFCQLAFILLAKELMKVDIIFPKLQ